MTRKLLAAFLALCMTMTLTPFAFAANTTDQGETSTNTNGTDINAGGGYSESDIAGNSKDNPPGGVSLLSNNVAKIGETEYATLAEAITAAGSNETTITLIADATENVTIPANANITLDLGGKTLTNTNAGTATISVAKDATATVKNGSVIGGTSYYNIAVGKEDAPGGTLTLENVTATAGNHGSSMIDNWGTLAIESGAYTGGLNVVKSEPNANLTINGGKFQLTSLENTEQNYYVGVILNYGTMVIKDGDFIQNATSPRWRYPQVILNRQEGESAPLTTVIGGRFTNNYDSSGCKIFHHLTPAGSNTFILSGGTFKTKAYLNISADYLDEGYTILLSSDKHSGSCVKSATDISLNCQTAEMKVGGDKLTLTATVSPSDAYQGVTWTSSSTSVAAVDKTGVVTAKKAGKTTITATAQAGGQKATCVITVTDEAASIEDTIYNTLEEALQKANNGDTIRLLKDIKLDAVLTINKDIIIDLDGHTLTGTTRAIKSGSSKKEYVAIDIKGGAVEIKNGKIKYRVNIYDTANVTIRQDVIIENKGYDSSTNGYGVVLQGSGTCGQDGCKTPVLNLYGKVNVTGTKGIGIATNAGDLSNPSINIYDGAEVTSQKTNVLDLSSGTTTISGGSYNGSLAVAEGSTLKISAGYFTADPSDYVDTGKAALDGTYIINDVTYSYKVDDALPSAVEVKAGNTAAEKADSNIPDDVVNRISEATVSGVTEKANEAAAAIKEEDKATITKLNEKLPEGATKATDSNAVTTVIAPRLDILVKSYDSESKTLSLDIEAVYDIKATTAPDNMIELDEDNADQVNTVTLKENAGKLDTTGTPVKINLTLPSGFAAKNDTLYITHTKSTGAKYVYPVTVQEDSAGNLYVEFTNDKGFSTFNVNKVVGASITTNGNTTYYETLQDAVDAVQNGETIEILKDGETATVSGRSVNFTVEPNGKNYTINLGSNCKNNATDANKYDIVYSRPSSGSGSSVTTYNVNVTTATNGTVTADKKTAAKGATVTITATPSAGYVVESVKVVDKDGKTVDVTAKDGKYSFVMPASAVTVTATFKAETPAPSGLPFTDVKEGDWFYGAVKYAYENGLMNGTGETIFAPNGTMNRAMIVTVLYRLEKSPAVTTASQFKDVPAGQWYSDAVAWAAANNIVNGYDETTFGPMNAVTREQMAAILFRYEQYKGMDTVTLEDNLAKFPDKDKISGYAVPALNWAVGQKVINGNADGTLDPTGTATRAQVAQILTNLLNK